MLSSVIIFVAPGTPTQIIVGLVITLVFLLLVSTVKPYEHDSDDFVQLCCFFSLCITLISGIAVTVQKDGNRDPRVIFAVTGIIFVLNALLLIAGIYVVYVGVIVPGLAKYHKSRDDAKKKLALQDDSKLRADLEEAFNTFDKEGKGGLGKEEFRAIMLMKRSKGQGENVADRALTEMEFETLFNQVDKDGSGFICFDEFYCWAHGDAAVAHRDDQADSANNSNRVVPIQN